MKNVWRRNVFIFKDKMVRKNIEGVGLKKIESEWIKDYYDEIVRMGYWIKKGDVWGEVVMRKVWNK